MQVTPDESLGGGVKHETQKGIDGNTKVGERREVNLHLSPLGGDSCGRWGEDSVEGRRDDTHTGS